MRPVIGPVVGMCLLTACASTADTNFGLPIIKSDLTIQSEPSGALAQVVYGIQSDQRLLSCTTPCTLEIPKGRAMRIAVSKDGLIWRTDETKLQWVSTLLGGYVLRPNPLVVKLERPPVSPDVDDLR